MGKIEGTEKHLIGIRRFSVSTTGKASSLFITSADVVTAVAACEGMTVTILHFL